MISVATLSLFRFAGRRARFWALTQMALARRPLARDPRIRFFRLCGSGTGEGFTPRPNWAVWAIVAEWDDLAAARAGTRDNPAFRRWRGQAAEVFTLFLEPVSARGRWAGAEPFRPARPPLPGDSLPAPVPGDGPLAALTRATLRPRHALRFWRRVPDISAAVGADPAVLFKIGIGEVPLLHQVTFSVWPDAASMADFARADGPHARAIRAVRAGDWFREELYARFRILGAEGLWGGVDPLAGPERERKAA